MDSRKTLLLLLASTLVPTVARADEEPPVAATNGASVQAASPREVSKSAAPIEVGQPASGEGQNIFVDRDGDGIQDGQEHRFRKRLRGPADNAADGGDGAGTRAMRRLRGGSGSGPGDGHGGGAGPGPRDGAGGGLGR